MNVAVKRVLVHGLGRAYAMHHHIGYMVLTDIGQHFLVKQSARDVVDEVGAFVHASIGNVFPERVDGNEHLGEGRPNGFQDGDNASHLFAFGGDGVVGPCGAAAYVDEVGTLGNHLLTVP